MFSGIYRNQRVLITGHTGFKGAWLSTWLLHLGAKVTGYSAYAPSDPSYFEVGNLGSRLTSIQGDIRDLDHLSAVFSDCQPHFVFHLAAQPIVRSSYDDPKLTFDTNAGGTVNVLECLRRTKGIRAAVIITSDKCYQNVEWPWGYRETDRLGGDDPYSASKACAEIICQAYTSSFFSHSSQFPRIATARAGNVIGGGDWAASRIVPDCVRAWADGRVVSIRNPGATRPWQHVLEPLSGYLWTGAQLAASERPHGQAFNFGPVDSLNRSVADLICVLNTHWESAKRWQIEEVRDTRKESVLLKLVCDKAFQYLGWRSALTFDQTVRLTAQWYRTYYSGHEDMLGFSLGQIDEYVSIAQAQDLAWATHQETK